MSLRDFISTNVNECGPPLTRELLEKSEQVVIKRERQVIGSGREDFVRCADCRDDICPLAKACVRAQVKT